MQLDCRSLPDRDTARILATRLAIPSLRTQHKILYVSIKVCREMCLSYFHYCYHWFFVPIPCGFFTPAGFSLKSSQVSGTLLQVLAELNYFLLYMAPNSPVFYFFQSFSKLLGAVLRAPTTIGIIVTYMLNSFFSSLARSKYLFSFLLSFIFTLWSTWTKK